MWRSVVSTHREPIESRLETIATTLAEDRPPLNNRVMLSRLISAFTRRPSQVWKADAAEQGHG